MEITKFLGDVNNISALSTKPNSIDGLTGPQLQAKWDKAGNDIKNYINNTLTTEIEDKIEILEDNTGTKTDTYSASATYAINDIVIHNNKLYKCTTAITVAEEFNPAKWLQVSLKTLCVPTITTDANDWKVFDFGTYKEWVKKGSITATLGGNLWYTLTGVSLPVGMSTISTNIVSTSLLSSDSAISLTAGGQPNSSLIYIHAVNNYGGSITATVYYQFRILQNS